VRKGAALSTCGTYRYALLREWDPALPRAVFVLLNPSTADAEVDDPTLRRGVGFARAWGYGAVAYVNLFAYRATDPAEMRAAEDPVGPENDSHILQQARMADIVVLAWGAHAALHGRDRRVLDYLEPRFNLYCLGRTKAGHPRHPLYLPGDTKPEPWRRTS